MDALVIADIGDESAWGEPIPVGPSKSPRPAWIAQAKHLDLAAEFFVLSVLHRMGVEATVTFSQSDNVDITVIHESGRVLTVDVRTLRGTKEWTAGRSAPRTITTSYSSRTRRMESRARSRTSTSSHRNASTVFWRENRFRSLSMDVLAKELAARDAWQELAIAPRPEGCHLARVAPSPRSSQMWRSWRGLPTVSRRRIPSLPTPLTGHASLHRSSDSSNGWSASGG